MKGVRFLKNNILTELRKTKLIPILYYHTNGKSKLHLNLCTSMSNPNVRGMKVQLV
jgi:hypothetical protein